ncbi:hypothetical protein ID866_7356 [Astraeus odoratus]|nr:hypothetical protein ID866_7356 [Astraeus odoratus]
MCERSIGISACTDSGTRRPQRLRVHGGDAHRRFNIRT